MYNGHPNYETWAAGLWLTNEEGIYYAIMEMAETETDTYWLGERIKSLVWEMAPEVEGLFADLIQSAMQNVEWEHIAAGLIEEA